MAELQIIGGGKMGEALLGGLVQSGWAPATELAVVEPASERRVELAQAHPGVVVSDTPLAGVDAIIAVKPQVVGVVASQLAQVGAGRVLSIAAGVKTAAIEAELPAGAVVVRAMPNTPSLVGKGAAGVAGGAAATDADIAWAASILGSVGHVEIVTEPEIDAVTGVSGSGPAYVFLLAEALIAAGQQVGLSEKTSEALAKQTILGAAVLMNESTESPTTLRENVTSPNGTTAAGLAVFEDHDFRGLVAKVVDAATRRSVELGS